MVDYSDPKAVEEQMSGMVKDLAEVKATAAKADASHTAVIKALAGNAEIAKTVAKSPELIAALAETPLAIAAAEAKKAMDEEEKDKKAKAAAAAGTATAEIPAEVASLIEGAKTTVIGTLVATYQRMTKDPAEVERYRVSLAGKTLTELNAVASDPMTQKFIASSASAAVTPLGGAATAKALAPNMPFLGGEGAVTGSLADEGMRFGDGGIA